MPIPDLDALDLTADWDARLAWAHAHRQRLHVEIDGARRIATLTQSDESRAVLRGLLQQLAREYEAAHPLEYATLLARVRALGAALALAVEWGLQEPARDPDEQAEYDRICAAVNAALAGPRKEGA